MPEIHGNTAGLSPSATSALERLYRRRVPLDSITTPELVRSLAEASIESKRQVGVLVHRSGVVDYVVVGTPTGLMLPDIGRLRAAKGRFRALRLVHTHLYNEPLTRDDFRRILTETEVSLIKQYVALMATEGVKLEFADDAVDAIADVAVQVNSSVENIGARRLQTVMERVLDEISFAAPDRPGETVSIDAAYVHKHIGDLARNADLSRFIL